MNQSCLALMTLSSFVQCCLRDDLLLRVGFCCLAFDWRENGVQIKIDRDFKARARAREGY